jgi:DNA-directed RNA polymerase II subunit RPB1
MKQYHHPLIREAKVNETLNKARDIGMRIAKNSAQERNNFLDLIESGAKGNWFNIAQITSLLGQQNLLGRRIPGMLYKSRTLSAYPFEGLTLEEKYESRGFVRNSFIHGLNPKEFFFHMMAGREAVTDTSQKTSITGYTSHKLAKVLANLSVKYDGTVRDDSGKVVQFKYNDDGLDVTKCVMVDGVPQFCDVGRLVQKLNEE